MTRCEHCGANLALVGKSHRCLPKAAKAVINIASEPQPVLLTPNAARQEKWRKANTELNKLRAREGMRKRRKKAET
jgi:hypothetical protein